MSSVRIALQPPPNVDFVVGYPGIPPGARDRPQAAVKGAVEVRIGPAGVKAKWVRVELKKIETLPGGGQANSYFDHVGPSPVSLWQSSEDYSLLHSQDFPFLIRIPESIPPSIALERGAGIRYELVATVCTLGKGGFFRRRKTSVVSQATTIIIDKHELHSTWPVYSQPESRSVHQEGVHLTVERGRTCYGPGDRVAVTAILKSEAVHPVVLRGFEFTLKETTIFRAGPQPTAKRSGPQVKTANIGEQKVPLNVTLYANTQHKAELGCLIPNTHTTTTLNAARHIDITYVIIVRAWTGAMQSIMMELPVIVSNWPRSVSEEAVRRIGPSPSLCVTSPTTPMTVPLTTTLTRPRTGDSQSGNPSNGFSGANDPNSRVPLAPPRHSIVQYNTAPPTGQDGAAADQQLEADELGALVYGSGSRPAGTINHPGYGTGRGPNSRGELGGVQEDAASRVPRKRPSANAQNRFTITNYSEKDAAEGINPQVMRATSRPTTPPTRALQQKAWPTAEDEKKKLYDHAVARVQKVQGPAVMASVTGGSEMGSSNNADSATTTPKKPIVWATAEEEKIRLYDHAQATAKRTQAFGVSSSSLHSRSSSEAINTPPARDKPSGSSSSTVVPGPGMSAGAAMYQQAISSMSKPSPSHPTSSLSSSPSPSLPVSGSRNVPHYPSAEEEKAALRRYHEAKLAVDRSHNTQYATREGIVSSSSGGGGGGPISYESLYPQPNGSGSAGGSDMPPPFEPSGSSSQPQYMNEKERLRRQYEAQDAATLAAQAQAQSPATELRTFPSYTAQTPAYSGPPPQESGLSEKEILRRRLEEQDRVALALQQQQQRQQQLQQQQNIPHAGPPRPPPRSNSARAQPAPPTAVNGFRPLTAAEEKAQLRARYESEERESYTLHDVQSPIPRHPYGSVPPPPVDEAPLAPPPPPPPPPLMPRPPAEYIQETQEVDMRVRYYDSLGVGLAEALDDHPSRSGSMRVTSPVVNTPLEIRPFSPFSVGMPYEGRPGMVSPGPPSSHGHGHGYGYGYGWAPAPPPAAQH